MNFSTLIGSIGVSFLLIAFALNLFKMISRENSSYILLNIIGAGLSFYASLLIRFFPFVFLEAIWCLTAHIALIRKLRTQ